MWAGDTPTTSCTSRTGASNSTAVLLPNKPLKAEAGRVDGRSMRISRKFPALVAGLAVVGALPATSAAAKPKPKPKPKPQIQAQLAGCSHTLGSNWPGTEGREANAMAIEIRATVARKGLAGASVTIRLTGPGVIQAGGGGLTQSLPSVRGVWDASGNNLAIFGADGPYRLTWTVKKKGYKTATGTQDVQAVAGREDWYGGYKGVPCEGWTPPSPTH
jgi:hypothetical protein